MLYRQKNKPAEEVINLLNEAVDAHFASLKVRLSNNKSEEEGVFLTQPIIKLLKWKPVNI